MNIKLELFSAAICDAIKEKLSYMDINVDKVVKSKAVSVLSEIQDALANDELSDFEVVEQIVCIFEKHKISCGGRHDF